MDELKILTIGDPHGVIPYTAKKLVKKYNPDVIVCTGDLPNADKFRKIIFSNWERLNEGVTVSEIMGKSAFKKEYIKSVKSTEVVLHFLNSLGKPIYLIYGNNDYPQKEVRFGLKGIEKQVKKYKNINLMNASTKNRGDYSFSGVSGCRGAVKNLKDKSLLNKFNNILSKAKNPRIFIYHDTPYGTKLDKVKNKDSPKNGMHIGEPFVNRVIKKYKPILYVCGHMHENPGTIKIGKTVCLNTGCVENEDYFLITLNNKNVSVKKIK